MPDATSLNLNAATAALAKAGLAPSLAALPLSPLYDAPGLSVADLVDARALTAREAILVALELAAHRFVRFMNEHSGVGLYPCADGGRFYPRSLRMRLVAAVFAYRAQVEIHQSHQPAYSAKEKT